jgi:hypothetical protein
MVTFRLNSVFTDTSSIHAYATVLSCLTLTSQDTETRSALLCEASAVVDFAALCLRGDTVNSSSRINSAIAQACYAVSCSTQRYHTYITCLLVVNSVPLRNYCYYYLTCHKCCAAVVPTTARCVKMTLTVLSPTAINARGIGLYTSRLQPTLQCTCLTLRMCFAMCTH